MLEQPKILYGVCGIGNGHTNRQLPIIEHFAPKARMVIFGYGESYARYSARFKDSDSVLVLPVEVPYYVGTPAGLDFTATASHPANKDRDFFATNSAAMAQAQRFLGKPDLVVSDYEPISAQYGYAHGAPLVTIDQQSKYLSGDFGELNGHSCRDEIQRLLMFFPRADARIACSFFKVPPKEKPDADVLLFPSILKGSVTKDQPGVVRKPNEVLVYVSSQQEFMQNYADIMRECASVRDTIFHIFAKGITKDAAVPASNVMLYEHGDPRFAGIFSECGGIVSTAGHTLLSEAMHVGVPVYAVPLPLYEQQMNAHVIDSHSFGVSRTTISATELANFRAGIPTFASNIARDQEVLLKGSSENQVIEYLEKRFLQ